MVGSDGYPTTLSKHESNHALQPTAPLRRVFGVDLSCCDLTGCRRATSESPLRVRQTPSAFHPRAQRNAFRRRDARQQPRLFARWNQSLRPSPNSNRLTEIVSDDFPVITRMTLRAVHVATVADTSPNRASPTPEAGMLNPDQERRACALLPLGSHYYSGK
jgi:hypothetical protein